MVLNLKAARGKWRVQLSRLHGLAKRAKGEHLRGALLPKRKKGGSEVLGETTKRTTKTKIKMSDQNLGIKETAEAVEFVGTLISNVAEAAQDNKLDWTDAIKFTASARKLPAAVSNYVAIPAELGDLSDEEADELVKVFAESLQLSDKEVEHFAERGVELAVLLTSYIADIVQYRKHQAEQI